MAAHDGVDAGDAGGHLEVDVHAVVRQHDNDLGALAARLVDHFLHAVVTDAEAPVRHQVARIGDRRVGEGLADDGGRDAVDFLDDVGLEDRFAPFVVDDILGDEIDLSLEILLDDFLDALGAIGHFPVRGHDVDAQQFLGVDHVLGLGPVGGAGALPGVATVQQQCAGTLGADLFHQCGKVGRSHRPCQAFSQPR